MSEKQKVRRIGDSQFLKKPKIPRNIYTQGAHSF